MDDRPCALNCHAYYLLLVMPVLYPNPLNSCQTRAAVDVLATISNGPYQLKGGGE